MGQYIRKSNLINKTFKCRYIILGTSADFSEIGKFQIQKVFKYIFIIFSSIRNLLFHRPDLCYFAITVKGLAFYKDLIIVILFKCFGVKLIYHLHNKGVSICKDKAIYNFFYKLVFNNAEVILLSKNLYQDIDKYVPYNSIYICPNGIPSNNYSSERILTYKKKINILFFSNLYRSKGVYVLLNALKVLKKKGIPFQGTFAGGFGDITGEQFQNKLIDCNIDNNVIYIGEINENDKRSMFINADIFAFPTYFETFGLVNIEAMKYGLPVISTFEGGIPDIIEDGKTGFLIPKHEVNSLADKLEILIKNNELRKSMGMKGRLRFERNFTLQKFENRMNIILLKCCK